MEIQTQVYIVNTPALREKEIFITIQRYMYTSQIRQGLLKSFCTVMCCVAFKSRYTDALRKKKKETEKRHAFLPALSKEKQETGPRYLISYTLVAPLITPELHEVYKKLPYLFGTLAE